MAADNTNKDNQKNIHIEVGDEEVVRSIEHGVMEDKPNYKRLVFWSLFGIVIFVVFLISLMGMYDYNNFMFSQQVSEQSTFTQINELRAEDQERLSSFGVVDEEQGVYHIPIDSAIKIMASGNN